MAGRCAWPLSGLERCVDDADWRLTGEDQFIDEVERIYDDAGLGW